MNCTVVIPQRKNRKLTKRLVEQIREHDDPAEIIIVNDEPGPPPAMDATMMSSGGRGVTAAWNTGLLAVRTEYACLLNNDIICSGPFLQTLMDAAGDGISGAQKREDRYLPKLRMLAGWCLCFQMATYHGLNGFDESMKMYYQDTDFIRRAHEQGVRIAHADVPLKHLGQRTCHSEKIIGRGVRLRQMSADRLVFLNKLKCASPSV